MSLFFPLDHRSEPKPLSPQEGELLRSLTEYALFGRQERECRIQLKQAGSS
jgi:hypothetical protein